MHYVMFGAIMAPLLSGTPADDTRQVISLDGNWTLQTQSNEKTHSVKVPGPWQLSAKDSKAFPGRASYTRDFDIPANWQGKRIFACFGAVDYYAEVSVNSQKAGSHEGGYTPFEFEISDSLRLGEKNALRLDVIDPGPNSPVEGFKFEEIPHGKQSWYGNTSGPWQSIRLEARAQSFIRRIAVDPDIDTSTARITVELDNPQAGQLAIRIDAPDGSPEVTGTVLDTKKGEAVVVWTASLPGAALWSPDSPALYTVTVRLSANGETDELSSTFGMRKIEAKDGKILLNNEPIFIAGALDQDFYPITEYTVPYDDYLRDQFLKAKRLGLNMLRCHIKVPDPRYLDWADRLGLLVWYEIPSWETLTEDIRRRAKQTFDEMMMRDHNHPSLVIVSIINEGWGIDTNNADHRKWMVQMYDRAKAQQPGRLIVDNSACGGNCHVKTDIEDYHVYFSIPDNARTYRKWISDFAGRPNWTFTDGPEKQRRGFEPLMLSEFGNWGLPRISNLQMCYEGLPWWFETGDGNALPAGVQDRFAQYHMDRVFGSMDGLSDSFQNQEWLSLKFQIEEMRKYPSVVGYIITEFTDLHWESNGLLDMCRNPKTFYDVMHTVQDQDIVFAQSPRTNYVSGEQVVFFAYISHFSGRDLGDCRIAWRVIGTPLSGEIEPGDIKRAQAPKVGEIAFAAPEADAPRRLRLEMSLLDSTGKELATNYQEFVVFPTQDPETPSDVMISAGLDSDAAARIADGTNAVICIESPDQARIMGGEIEVVDREAKERWGNWCTSLIWFKDSAAFDKAPVPRTLDFSFENIIPACVIQGVPPQAYENDVFSGIFVGWVQSNAAIVAQARIGKGKVIFTTLPLISALKNDPMARFLLASLAQYVDSERCDPKLEITLQTTK